MLVVVVVVVVTWRGCGAGRRWRMRWRRWRPRRRARRPRGCSTARRLAPSTRRCPRSQQQHRQARKQTEKRAKPQHLTAHVLTPSRPFILGVFFGGYPNGFARPTSAWLAGQEGDACATCSGNADNDDANAASFRYDAATGEVTPASFAATLLPWAAQRGARLLGGCCACGPGQIAALAAALGRETTDDDDA
jgi:hypothetical protein